MRARAVAACLFVFTICGLASWSSAQSTESPQAGHAMTQASTTEGPIDAAIRGQNHLPTPPLPTQTGPIVGTALQARPRRESRPFTAVLADAWDANALQPAIGRLVERVGLLQKTDPGFSLTPELMSELSVGIPDNQLSQFGWAVNRDHAVIIRNQILDRIARNERLAGDGFSGTLVQAVIYVIDPIFLTIYALVFLFVFLIARKLLPKRSPKAVRQPPGTTGGYRIEGEDASVAQSEQV